MLGSALAVEQQDRSFRDLPAFKRTMDAFSADFDILSLWRDGLGADPVGWLAGRGWQAPRAPVYMPET